MAASTTGRYGIVADIHSNVQAFDAVLEFLDAEGVDAICCLGDVVGYGGDPAACVARVRERCRETVRGNHDLAVIDPRLRAWFNPHARRAIERQAELLDENDKAWLSSLPATIERHGMALTHSGFADPDAFDYVVFSRQAVVEMRAMPADLGFYGHTHVPAAFRLQPEERALAFTLVEGDNELAPPDRYLINPGAVGQPRDGDPRAACAIWDARRATLCYARIEYDISRAQEAIARTGMPAIEAARLARGA